MANYVPLMDKKGYLELRDILLRNIKELEQKEKEGQITWGLAEDQAELEEVEERIQEIEEKESKKGKA